MPPDRQGLHLDPVAHRYWTGSRELLGVTAVLHAAGLIDPTWYTAEGRIRGIAVHRATHARDRGDEASTRDGTVAPYLDAYEQFLHDARPVWHGVEESVADLALGYAGTPDRWGTLQSESVVVDLKTGTVPDWAPLQLVAYGRLALDDTRVHRRRRLVVHLRPTGRYSIREYPAVNFGRDERVFLAALAVAQWKRAA